MDMDMFIEGLSLKGIYQGRSALGERSVNWWLEWSNDPTERAERVSDNTTECSTMRCAVVGKPGSRKVELSEDSDLRLVARLLYLCIYDDL
ncbi:hypothetical protein KQX54_020981 [Cotesia glomerata]|uniref:Uncharacterized protein n=1 Tax=Cotesia glomerata TaxID=32391 RepID=A0AAV7I225_COTGL|nr:hypothetical protein KQX54_020981 [Cotesia glomerata]